MADAIKIPYGWVLALSDKEWARVVAAIKMMVEVIFTGDSMSDADTEMRKELEQLFSDLSSPRDAYGSGETH